MNRISILGCGWLGLPLAKAFLKDGCRVNGSVTSIEKKEILSAFGIQAYVINLANEITQADFFSSEVLVVTVPPRRRSQEAGVYKQHIKKLVDYIALQNHINHVIYTSSTSVYKDENRSWKENDLTSLEESANEELFEVESLFLSLVNKKVSILRLGGLTGGTRMLAKHFAGKKDIAGGGRPVNLVHFEDVVAAIQFVVKKELTGVYNICALEHPSKKDFYTALALKFELEAPEFLEELFNGKMIDSTKLEEAGYEFKYSNPFLFTYEA